MRADAGIERTVVGFHEDDACDWVAELECGHNRHVRHHPPWTVRPWVLSEEGRLGFIGCKLTCTKCLAQDPIDAETIASEI